MIGGKINLLGAAGALKKKKPKRRAPKITSIEDVEKALNQIWDVMPEKPAEIIVDEEGVEDVGSPGDLRIVESSLDKTSFEVYTKHGWARPYYHSEEVSLEIKKEGATTGKSLTKPIDKIEEEDLEKGTTKAKETIFDEDSGKFVLPRPDYDSKWINYDFSAHTINGGVAWRHTHTLGQLPTLIKIYFAPDQNNGDMGTGDTLTEPQTNVTWFTEINNILGASEHNNDYYGIVYRIDKDYLYLASGEANSGMYSDWSMTNANISGKHDGAIRLLMWK